MGLRSRLAFVAAALLIVLLVSYLAQKRKATQELAPSDFPSLPGRGFFMGLLPTPARNQTFADAYLQASGCCDFVPLWGRPSPFYELANDISGPWGRTFLDEYIRRNGMFPLVLVSFIGQNMTLRTPPDMPGSTLSSEEWRRAYRKAVLDVVRTAKPPFICIGNEVNRWHERYGAAQGDPNGFQNYVTLYEELYDAVKAISPQTKVFCTFSREIVSENREANLSVLSMFSAGKMDLLVLTSYPYAVKGINRPSDIPDDYYLKAAACFPGKPFGFTEVGWASLEPFGGENGQADFLKDLTSRLTLDRGLDLTLLGYAWLHDLDDKDAIGLIYRNGTAKLGFEVWQKLFSS